MRDRDPGASRPSARRCRPSKRIVFRIGVNLGDVLIEGDDILLATASISPRGWRGFASPRAFASQRSAYRPCSAADRRGLCRSRLTRTQEHRRPVRVYAIASAGSERARASRPPCPSRTGASRLSIVVLPFANIGGGLEQEHFVDGVTESLTTDLSRIRGALVIARNTAFTYKGKPLDVKTIGRELNVRYVLEGSVQRGGTACASTCSSSTPKRAITSGPSGSTRRSPISSTCRTKSSRGSQVH